MRKPGLRRLSALLLALLVLAGCARQEEDPLAAYDGTWYFYKNAVACEFGDQKIYRDDYTAQAGQTLAGIYFDAGDHIEANLSNTGDVHQTRELYLVATEEGDILCDDPEGSGTVYFYRDPLAAMAAVEKAQSQSGGDTEPERSLPAGVGPEQGQDPAPESNAPSPATQPFEAAANSPDAKKGDQTRSAPTTAETDPPEQVTGPDASGGKVWIPQSGSKYHRTADCSGMKSPKQVTLGEAQSQGYTPCKRCY